MPAPQSTPADPADTAPDDLDQLVKAGLRLVHLLERHVEAAVVIAEAHAACELPDPFPLPPLPNYPADVGLIFSRIARAVRLTKALQTRLARAPQGSPAGPERAGAPRGAGARSGRYLLNLQDPDGDHIEPSDASPRLDHDGWERLEDEDADADILSRPVPEIIAVIRHDLGLDGDAAPTPPHQTPANPPPDPKDVGVVRGQTFQTEGRPRPQGREATNPTNHTNAILPTPRPGRPPWPPP